MTFTRWNAPGASTPFWRPERMQLAAALIQLNCSDDPAANLPETEALICEAAAGGARLVLTPEVTNIVSTSRTVQNERLALEADDPTLSRLREVAAECGVWLSLGSLALKSGDPDGRFVNRQFLITPEGAIAAHYDKIHMFDVILGEEEIYKESSGYRPRLSSNDCRDALGGPWPDHLLRHALPGALPGAGRGRGSDLDRPLGLHRAHGPRPLGGAAARPRR